jgi:hypothetical protein
MFILLSAGHQTSTEDVLAEGEEDWFLFSCFICSFNYYDKNVAFSLSSFVLSFEMGRKSTNGAGRRSIDEVS